MARSRRTCRSGGCRGTRPDIRRSRRPGSVSRVSTPSESEEGACRRPGELIDERQWSRLGTIPIGEYRDTPVPAEMVHILAEVENRRLSGLEFVKPGSGVP